MGVLPSRIRLGSACVLNRISTTAWRPPSSLGRSSCETIPASDSDRLARACACSSVGNESMMRSTVLAAPFVCSVPKTSMPISAAVIASEIVS